MSRITVEVDDAQLAKAMQRYNLRTKQKAIALALRRLVGEYDQIDVLDLEGMGWEGDLEEMRRDRVADLRWP